MIPSLTNYGFLPTGQYECLLAEVEDRFAFNLHRKAQWERFEKYVEWTKNLHFYRHLFIGGSYVTNKPDPRDIDVEIVPIAVRSRSQEDFFKPMQPQFTKPLYGVDALPCLGNPIVLSHVRDQDRLGKVIPVGYNKGVLKVML